MCITFRSYSFFVWFVFCVCCVVLFCDCYVVVVCLMFVLMSLLWFCLFVLCVVVFIVVFCVMFYVCLLLLLVRCQKRNIENTHTDTPQNTNATKYVWSYFDIT